MPSDDFDDFIIGPQSDEYWFGEEDWHNNNDLIEWGMEEQYWDHEYDEYPPDETDTDIFDEA